MPLPYEGHKLPWWRPSLSKSFSNYNLFSPNAASTGCVHRLNVLILCSCATVHRHIIQVLSFKVEFINCNHITHHDLQIYFYTTLISYYSVFHPLVLTFNFWLYTKGSLLEHSTFNTTQFCNWIKFKEKCDISLLGGHVNFVWNSPSSTNLDNFKHFLLRVTSS